MRNRQGLSTLPVVNSHPNLLTLQTHVHIDRFSGLIKDGLVHGRGPSDQKGGAASMITAGRILKDLDYSGEYSVILPLQ
jgi:acetylornithine deacetylase/succinyl-diaminopimelate desuccinylase-like protein